MHVLVRAIILSLLCLSLHSRQGCGPRALTASPQHRGQWAEVGVLTQERRAQRGRFHDLPRARTHSSTLIVLLTQSGTHCEAQ